MKDQSVSIVGAGIGGLSAALFLKKRGIEVRVFESAPAIRPVGAGIVLASNAMQIFRNEGLYDRILSAGQQVSAMRITDENFKDISCVKLARFEQKYGVCNVAIHRAALQGILAEMVGKDQILLSRKLIKIEGQGRFKLHFEDGSLAESDTLIGADGIRSTVRDQLLGHGRIRGTGQKCWRGVCRVSLTDDYAHQAIEAWGRGKRFGFVRIDHEQIYWYAALNSSFAGDHIEELGGLFRDFHPDALRMIESTESDQLHFSDITDLSPVSSWYTGQACLLGDAAHAMTPNMGQGACQAIEDAYTISKLMEGNLPIRETFERYQQLRIRKARGIVDKSRLMGSVSHLDTSLGIWLRNSLMRLVPASFNERQLSSVFDIDYV